MLYHWYELVQEIAAPTNTADDAVLRPRAPNIRYNAATALAHARGAPFQFDDASFRPSAANDLRADKLATRLRDAGVGRVGEPKQRVLPHHYCFMQRPARLCRSAIGFILVCLTEVRERFAWKPRDGVSGCSHTMVSNRTEYAGRTRDDARRQRFNASIG